MKKEFFPIVLILILAFSRIIPHPPNFTINNFHGRNEWFFT